MKPDQILFVTSHGWWELANGQASEVTPWLQPKGTALVVVDFTDSVIGLQHCKGKKSYAAAQIEKTIRSEGVIDGPVHVIMHKQIGNADSNQTLYTAVPLALWQEFQVWSAQQVDHCFIVPLASLLAEQPKNDRPIIFHTEHQLYAFVESEGKMYYASATTIDAEVSDFAVAVRTLASQLRLAGWRSTSNVYRWASLRSESLAAEQELVRQLGQDDVIKAELQRHDSFNVDAKHQMVTALPGLLDNVPTRSFATPALARAAWLSEKYVLRIVAVVAVVTIGLSIFTWIAQSMVRDEIQSAQTAQSELEALRERINKASSTDNAAETPDMAFAQKMGFAVIYDPNRMLGTVRRAAGNDVRIQRLQLVDANTSKPTRFRVDGVANNASPQELSRFLTALRTGGWQAESTAPLDNSVGAFAYYLTVIAPESSRHPLKDGPVGAKP